MASTRPESKTLPDDRLHVAAGKKNGYATVKELIEVEKININKVHSKTGWTPLVYAARWGDLNTLVYLVENKAEVKQNGVTNLLDLALIDGNDPEKIKYIASLYSSFGDRTTALHAAVGCQNYAAINALAYHDPNSVLIRDNYGRTPFSYAVELEHFEIAKNFLEVYAPKGDRTILLENVDLLLAEMSEQVEPTRAEKESYRKIIQPLIPLIESNTSLHSQLTLNALKLFNHSLLPIHDWKALNELSHTTLRLVQDSKETVRSASLAVTYNNIEVELKELPGYESLFDLYEIGMHILPALEIIFLNMIKDALVLKQYGLITKTSQKIATLLESKAFFQGYNSDIDQKDWLAEVILPLIKIDSKEMREAAAICLKLALAITPRKSYHDQDYISVLLLCMTHNYLKLNKLDDAMRSFNEFKSKKSVYLDNTVIDEFIIVAGAFAKIKNFEILSYAMELSYEDRFLERLKNMFKQKKQWETIRYVLQGLHEIGKLRNFLPNTLIDGIPLIIHVVKEGQDEIVKFFFEHASVFPGKGNELMATHDGDKALNCTALYFAGIAGNLTLFRYLLEKGVPLYHPLADVEDTKPFIHALFANAATSFSKLEDYHMILKLVATHFPDELNAVWEDQTVRQSLEMMPEGVIPCLRLAINLASETKQKALQAQILKHITQNETITALYSGAEKLLGKFVFKNNPSEEVNVTQYLRSKIETLGSLINPYTRVGLTHVTETFYNEKFLKWKLENRGMADSFPNVEDEKEEKEERQKVANLGLISTVEIKPTQQVIDEINIVFKLVQDYIAKPRMSLSLENTFEMDDRICEKMPSQEEKKETKAISGRPTFAQLFQAAKENGIDSVRSKGLNSSGGL